MANRGPCVEKQMVWSPAYQKYVERCAEFAGGGGGSFGDLGEDVILEFEGEGGSFGQFGILETLGLSVSDIKNAITTGGVAAGGAWGVAKLTQTLLDKFPSLKTTGIPELVNLGVGLISGGLVSKYYRPSVGANLMIGPAVVSALSLLGLTSDVLAISSGAGIAGLGGGNNLGLMTARQSSFEPVSQPPTRSYNVSGHESIV